MKLLIIKDAHGNKYALNFNHVTCLQEVKDGAVIHALPDISLRTDEPHNKLAERILKYFNEEIEA